MSCPWAQRNVNISLYVWQKAARAHGSGHWTLDAGLTLIFKFKPSVKEHIKIIEIPWFLSTFWYMACPWAQQNALNSLGFIDILIHGLSMDSTKCFKFLRFYWLFDTCPVHWLNEMLILAYTCDKKRVEPMVQATGRWTRCPPRERHFFFKSA